MTAETILTALIRINLVASVAIVLVLALRPWVLRWLGSSIAYWLWLVVPIAAAASFLPVREQIVLVPLSASRTVTESAGPVETSPAPRARASAEVATTPVTSLLALADVLVAVWLLGAGALLVGSIVRTRRLAADPSVGPALVGVLRPRLVLPADFETRFDAEERTLILAHEHVHRVSGHTIVNALIEIVRCTCWFNPLAHLAAIRVRTDQELACDAAVIATRPSARRTYGQALLKTQVAPAFLRLGCTWTSRSGKRLGERIEMLGRPSLSRRGAVLGASAVAVVGLALGYAAWAQQPDRLVTRTAAPRDPRIGHWHEQPGPGSFGLHITYEDLGDGRFRYTMFAHAPPMNQLIAEGKCDGGTYPFLYGYGTPSGNTVSCRITGPLTMEYVFTRGDKTVWATSTGVEAVSADGNTLTWDATHRDKDGRVVEERHARFSRRDDEPRAN